jgi:hypothetical protein
MKIASFLGKGLAKALGAALLLALVHPAAAIARDQVNGKDPVVVDPQRSYIFYRSKVKLAMRFLRDVSAADREIYDADRAKAYEKAKKSYDRDLAVWRSKDRAYNAAAESERMHMPRPHKPDAITPDDFPFPAAETRNFVEVSAGPQFGKSDAGYTYLIAVPPGTYTLYGQLTENQNGIFGVCLCMGSLKFEAKAGEIVDMGEIGYPRVAPIEAGAKADSFAIMMTPALSIVPAEASAALPDRLKGLPVVQADLRAADKMPNYFGISISRIAPLPGVLAYERDKVIDLKAGGTR